MSAPPRARLPRVLTIAGSDSGGGAGIQADLKTFAAHGVYGTSAIAALTAQNTLGVDAVHETPPAMVRAQIDSVLSDIGADTVKIGMLASAAIVEAVAEALVRHGVSRVVLDPVMVSKSGAVLLAPEAQQALITHLLPLALVLTPNLPEAAALAGRDGTPEELARALHAMGPRWVLVKGGHGEGDEVRDLLWNGEREWVFRAPRQATRFTHGTGCTLSSAIAANLAHGRDVPDAVERAIRYTQEAMAAGFEVGRGFNPVDHFYAWREVES